MECMFIITGFIINTFCFVSPSLEAHVDFKRPMTEGRSFSFLVSVPMDFINMLTHGYCI